MKKAIKDLAQKDDLTARDDDFDNTMKRLTHVSCNVYNLMEHVEESMDDLDSADTPISSVDYASCCY